MNEEDNATANSGEYLYFENTKETQFNFFNLNFR